MTRASPFRLIVGLIASWMVAAFVPTHRVARKAPLLVVISSDDVDFDYDVGQGGVRLAQDSAIKIGGSVKTKTGQPEMEELLRYKKLTEVSDVSGVSVLASGRGKEDYRDPGSSTNKEVTTGPHDAVRDALNGMASATGYGSIFLNFLGGDDMQVLETLDATKVMIDKITIDSTTSVAFNSVSHSSVPRDVVTLTVVGVSDETSGASKPSGEVYFLDGKYWTVSADDIQDAVA